MNLGRLLEERSRESGKKIFVFCDDQTITYGAFDENTNKIANSLYQLGVRQGDHVAALMPNHVDFIYLFFAIAKLGGVNIFLDLQYDPELIRHAIQICDCKIAVVDESVYHKYRNLRSEFNKIDYEIAYPNTNKFSDHKDMISFIDLLNGPSSPPPSVPIRPGDPVQFIFTSGTTGLPKPCVLSHNARIAVSQHINDSLKASSEDRFYACLPNYHGNVYLGINGALLAGGSVAVGKRFSASWYWDDVRRYKATILVLHITPINILVKQERKDSDHDNPARAAVFTVGIHAKDFMERFHIKTGLACYGTTEAGGFSAMSAVDIEDFPKNPGFCGRERDDFEIKILNDEDEELGPGEIGEIVVRPKKPFVMFNGYYNMPDKTVEKCRNLYFHSGDLGFKDEEGFLYFIERKENSVRVKGNFVPVDHVESRIRAHPEIQECAIVGVPSDVGEQDIKACIQLNENSRITPEEIILYCTENLSGYMVPRYIEFVDSLPISSSALKVQKSKLKAKGIGKAWDRNTGQWIHSHRPGENIHKF